MDRYICVDIGGTKTLSALMDKRGRILKTLKLKTGKGRKPFLKGMESSISMLFSKDVKGIGIGVPGPLDIDKGVLLNPANLKGCDNLNLVSFVKKRFGVKVVLENDTTAMALGEAIVGLKNRYRSFVFINVGTGLGGGIVLNGKIYRGKGNAGEIGHTIIDPKGIKCTCGNRGCLESYVSDRAFKRVSKRVLGRELDPEQISKLLKSGNKKAREVCKEIGQYLGIGLANINDTLDPDVIVLGGGVLKLGSAIMEPALKEMEKRLYVKPAHVMKARLSDNSGLYGLFCLLGDKDK